MKTGYYFNEESNLLFIIINDKTIDIFLSEKWVTTESWYLLPEDIYLGSL